MAKQLAYRLGRGAGRAWRGIDQIMIKGLTAAGLPAGAAKTLLWGVKLAVLVGLLYVAFWLAAVVIGIAVAVWNGKHPVDDVDEDGCEWRHDHLGFGLYDQDGYRIDSAYSGHPED
ncbi:MAG: DUF3742 family protein [Zoogloeaceae bacterium]|jgi:hypothetical protein|nr:DUF3742 family protein [Zoogloeaceae bacterium]